MSMSVQPNATQSAAQKYSKASHQHQDQSAATTAATSSNKASVSNNNPAVASTNSAKAASYAKPAATIEISDVGRKKSEDYLQNTGTIANVSLEPKPSKTQQPTEAKNVPNVEQQAANLTKEQAIQAVTEAASTTPNPAPQGVQSMIKGSS